MKILYDHQIFQQQKFGGISRYHANLFYGLKEIGIETQLEIRYTNNIYLQKNGFAKTVQPLYDPYSQFMYKKEFLGKRKLYNLKNKIIATKTPFQKNQEHMLRTLENKEYQLFHPTYYDPYFLQKIRTPYVLTVHDMIHEMYPEMLYGDPTVFQKQKLIKKAVHIITVSHTTKVDLLKFYQIPEEKITVIYHGINLEATKTFRQLPNLPKKYILFVGNRSGYKNFLFTLRAVGKILKKQETHLLCVGPGFDSFEEQYIQQLGLSQWVKNHKATDEELPCLYANAQLFIFPSLHEGFGIPIIEAMNAGCPLLLSDIRVFREIAGGTAIYFNPKDPSAIEYSLGQILDNPKIQQDLAKKGKEKVKTYSIQKMLQQTQSLYKKLIEE